jgi:hypothetical protein
MTTIYIIKTVTENQVEPVECFRKTFLLVVKSSVSRLEVEQVKPGRLVRRVVRLVLQDRVEPGQ